MNIALIYGRWCSGGPDAFDLEGLYRTKGLTGSESFFFNTARGLAEQGHTVQVFADVKAEDPACAALAGAAAFKLESADKVNRASDAVLAWNEPDLMREVTARAPGALRVCVQQLNDFDYASPDFRDLVDLFAFPSRRHLEYMVEVCKIDPLKSVVVSNSINPEFFEPDVGPRRRHSIAYCSSPDRGLHWLLDWWPAIRRRVPDAELRIYYKVDPWLQQVRDGWWDHRGSSFFEVSFRARYVEECLRRLGRNGQCGVTVVGPIANVDMALELKRTEVMAYPCDTVRWTEGFGVSVIDACAAGCVPIISDVDAFGSVHDGGPYIIPGRPQSRDERWIGAITDMLLHPEMRTTITERAQAHAAKFTRVSRAHEWSTLLYKAIAARQVAA